MIKTSTKNIIFIPFEEFCIDNGLSLQDVDIIYSYITNVSYGMYNNASNTLITSTALIHELMCNTTHEEIEIPGKLSRFLPRKNKIIVPQVKKAISLLERFQQTNEKDEIWFGLG